MRLYGKDYGKRLASAGFKVHEDDYVKKIGEEKVRKYSLPKEEIIYYCMK